MSRKSSSEDWRLPSTPSPSPRLEAQVPRPPSSTTAIQLAALRQAITKQANQLEQVKMQLQALMTAMENMLDAVERQDSQIQALTGGSGIHLVVTDRPEMFR